MKDRKILIVEDEHDSRMILQSFLERRGYAALSTASGCQALVLIAEEKPDLVFLDVSIDELNGIEVLKELRRTDPATKVVVLTGQVFSPAEHDDLAGLGVFKFLEKPVSLLQLEDLAACIFDAGHLPAGDGCIRSAGESHVNNAPRHQINNCLGMIRNACENFIANAGLDDARALPAAAREELALGVMRDVVKKVDKITEQLGQVKWEGK